MKKEPTRTIITPNDDKKCHTTQINSKPPELGQYGCFRPNQWQPKAQLAPQPEPNQNRKGNKRTKTHTKNKDKKEGLGEVGCSAPPHPKPSKTHQEQTTKKQQQQQQKQGVRWGEVPEGTNFVQVVERNVSELCITLGILNRLPSALATLDAQSGMLGNAKDGRVHNPPEFGGHVLGVNEF